MATTVRDEGLDALFVALAEPFRPPQLKMKPGQGGRQLAFVSARTVMNRLDDVVGFQNWWDEYVPGENSVLCKLTIRLPDGSTLTKQDAGGHAGMSDGGDDEKSGYSDALKRAAAKFGVGRHLYGDGLPRFVEAALGMSGRTDQPSEFRGSGRSDPGSNGAPRPDPRANGHAPAAGPANAPRPSGNGDAPRSGKALFAMLKDLEDQNDVILINPINTEAKKNGVDQKMIDWAPDWVAWAWEMAGGMLRAKGGGGSSPAAAEDARGRCVHAFGQLARDIFAIPQGSQVTKEHYVEVARSIALDLGLAPLESIVGCEDVALLKSYAAAAAARLEERRSQGAGQARGGY